MLIHGTLSAASTSRSEEAGSGEVGDPPRPPDALHERKAERATTRKSTTYSRCGTESRHMNILAVYVGVESFYLAGLVIPLAIGCICGLIAVRHKPVDSMVNVVAIVLAPILAVVGMFIFALLVDLVDAPHRDSTYFPMLVQSMARALLFLPAMCLIATPLSIVACVISQLLSLRVAQLWHGR